MWVVEFEGYTYGPFESEDACYDFAAQVSREANDWTPLELTSPGVAIKEAAATREP